VRLLGEFPQRPVLAEKWKQGPLQLQQGPGAAAQQLLTAVLTQQAPQTAAMLPPVALQPRQVAVPPPLDA